jgi:hypothetical protein
MFPSEGDCQLGLTHAAEAVKPEGLPFDWAVRNGLRLGREVSLNHLHLLTTPMNLVWAVGH